MNAVGTSSRTGRLSSEVVTRMASWLIERDACWMLKQRQADHRSTTVASASPLFAQASIAANFRGHYQTVPRSQACHPELQP